MYDVNALGLNVVSFVYPEARCLCPFHSDHTPSATFNVEKGLFHCFACGDSLNAAQLARLLDGYIVQTTSPPSLKRRNINESVNWIELLPLAVGNEYLDSRGVDDWLIKKYKIRESHDGIFFPLYTDKLNGAQIRRYSGRPRYTFIGKRIPLWPMSILHTMKNGETLFVTEGVFGAIRAIKAGRKAVTVMGANSSRDALPYLASFNVVVAFDSDKPGIFGALKIVSALPKAKAIVPGLEADEVSVDIWQHIEDEYEITKSVNSLASCYGDKTSILNKLNSFMSRERKRMRV